jgi:hypothetical protein
VKNDDEKLVLDMAGLVVDVFLAATDEGQSPDPKSFVTDAQESVFGRRGIAGLRRLLPLRIGRYAKHLLTRLEQENAQELQPAVHVAVSFVLDLLHENEARARRGWRGLVDLAGPSDAEWLVSELIVETDIVAVHCMYRVMRCWAAVVDPSALPTCLAIDERPDFPKRAPYSASRVRRRLRD